MKKLFGGAVALVFFFALTSIAYSADEALTPEKICGIWEGTLSLETPGYPRYFAPCRILFKPDLTGILRYNTPNAALKYVLDGKGDISNNQLIIRDRENPDIIRLKAYMTKKNLLEGNFKGKLSSGDLSDLKKIKELKDEEKELPLSQLEGLY